MAYHVVITDLEHPSIAPELEVLGAIDAHVERYHCRVEEEVIDVAAHADALMIAFAPITGRVLAALPRCCLVARYGAGVDTIDVQAATQQGVMVTNVPDFCVDEVADHTLALLLAWSRKIVYLDRQVRAGRAAEKGYWKTTSIASPMFRLNRQSLGIIGLGRIGQRVALRARAFGLRVLAAPDPGITAEQAVALGVEMLPLEDVLRQADYLTLHVPLTAGTHHLLDASKLALMKPGAVVVNASRGPVIDEQALIDALQNGKLAGAALDVYESEPLDVTSPLLAMDNVVLCSHAAWYSEEAFVEMKVKTAQAVVDFVQGQVPRYLLNPEVLTSPRLRRLAPR